MNFLDTIPDEILIIIFKLHVWANSGSPQCLCRVSRRFYVIAIETKSIWGNIALTSAEWIGKRDHKRDLEGKIICNSPEQLARAIDRTKSTYFDLTIILRSGEKSVVFEEESWNALQISTFEGSCRTLNLVSGDVEWLAHHLQALTMLQRLELRYTGWNYKSKELASASSILYTATRTSQKLQYLWAAKAIPRANLALIPPGLTSFWIGPRNFRAFAPPTTDNIQIGHKASVLSPQHDIPALSRLRLGSSFMDLFSRRTLMNLTRLTLYSAQHAQIPAVQQFPTLLHLTLTCSWRPLIYIHAPLLQRLDLKDKGIADMIDAETAKSTTLKPRRLDVDMRIEDKELLLLLWGPWSDLEELRIVYTRYWLFPAHKLLLFGLSIQSGYAYTCPILQKLVVSLDGDLSQDIQRRSEVEEGLCKVVDSRRGNGTLKSVRMEFMDPDEPPWDSDDEGIELADVRDWEESYEEAPRTFGSLKPL